MKNRKFVICIKNTDYPASLELRKIYEVVPDDDISATGHVRVIDESGDDYLYPSSYFIDAQLSQSVLDAVIKAA
jgi:hypothetical protein